MSISARIKHIKEIIIKRGKELLRREISLLDIWHVFFPVFMKVVLSFVCATICIQSFYLSMTAYAPFESGIYIDRFSYNQAFHLTIMAFLSVAMISKRTPIALGLTTLVLHIVALINYFELDLHGTVLTYKDIWNIGTAANVLGEYKIQFTIESRFILLSAVAIILIMIELLIRKVVFHRNIILGIIMLIACVNVVRFNVDSVDPWSWEELYYKKGYIVGTIQHLARAQSLIRQPEGYTEELIAEKRGIGGTVSEYPDIILILNESYYDIGHLTTLKSDVDYMEYYNALGAIKGYASVPLDGGGTNDTEYELLTENSLALLYNYSPFSNLSMKNANSIVRYLESIGYSTMAAHPETSGNYHRGTAWRDLGFDYTYFDDDFDNLDYYGNRKYATDSSSFNIFKQFYESMPVDRPRFAYLLTIQNHGGWDINEPELDIVHVSEISGYNDKLTKDTYVRKWNEYLSAVKLTDDFIRDLTDYFGTTDRPTVICMVGDHAPSLAKSINSVYNEREKYLRIRQVPYFIWTNYEPEVGLQEVGNIDVCALMPFVLKTAGMPLSPYYETLVELSEDVQSFTNVISSQGERFGGNVGGYISDDGALGDISDNTRSGDLLRDYFYMEYNNIGDTERIQSLFDAPVECIP